MEWCPVCCTRHDDGAECPGQVLATGPERRGRTFLAVEGAHVERYAVLIAEAGRLWRARIMTFPNMLWSVPGGRGTIKFVGPTATDAERRAVAFIEERCRARGSRLSETGETVEAGRVDPERFELQSPSRSKEERHARSIRIRFGEQGAVESARTADLSYGGLFVITERPVPAGRTIKMVLELGEYSIPLAGKVAWVRVRPEGGRPSGMGIELLQAPPLYVRYVKGMKQEEPKTEQEV